VTLVIAVQHVNCKNALREQIPYKVMEMKLVENALVVEFVTINRVFVNASPDFLAIDANTKLFLGKKVMEIEITSILCKTIPHFLMIG